MNFRGSSQTMADYTGRFGVLVIVAESPRPAKAANLSPFSTLNFNDTIFFLTTPVSGYIFYWNIDYVVVFLIHLSGSKLCFEA